MLAALWRCTAITASTGSRFSNLEAIWSNAPRTPFGTWEGEVSLASPLNSPSSSQCDYDCPGCDKNSVQGPGSWGGDHECHHWLGGTREQKRPGQTIPEDGVLTMRHDATTHAAHAKRMLHMLAHACLIHTCSPKRIGPLARSVSHTFSQSHSPLISRFARPSITPMPTCELPPKNKADVVLL